MEIHLDTNFLIGLAHNSFREDARLRRWLAQGQVLRTSSVAWAEFLCGPLKPGAAAKVRSLMDDPESFTTADAAHSAELFNATGRRRGSLTDCMIAAIALRCDGAVATNDSAHFKRFVPLGLKIAE